MNNSKGNKPFTLFYSLIISIMAFAHLYRMHSLFGVEIPTYLTVIMTGISFYFLYKKAYWRIKSLLYIGLNVNTILLLAQFMIVGLYTVKHSMMNACVSPLLFILLEYIRFYYAQAMGESKQKLEQLEQAQEDINETFRVIRKERHDFLKHITAVHFLLEKNEYLNAKQYMDSLVDTYEETNLAIKGEEGIVAGLLHRTYQQAKENGIHVEYQFDLPLSTLPLKNQEIVGLLGNILSNALESCFEWKAAEREDAKLMIEFYKRSGLFILVCKNSAINPNDNRFDFLFKEFGFSSKGKGHEGLGTKIISDIVRQNNGFLDFTFKEDEFSLKIKFPSIQ